MDSLTFLKDKGYKATRARSAIIKLFARASLPASAKDVITCLAKEGLKVNKTTIYRELEFLTEQNILQVIHWGDSVIRYEKAEHGGNHHHHLICNTCGRVEDVNLKDEKLVKEASQTGFKVKSHSLEFFGLCTGCQN